MLTFVAAKLQADVPQTSQLMSSIGSALARQLTGAGQEVVLAGRTAGPLEELGRELDAPHRILDATDIDAVQAAFGESGPLTGVVNCVGSLLLKPAHRTSADEWDAVLDTNLRSAFATVRAGAGDLLIEGRRGLDEVQAVARLCAAIFSIVNDIVNPTVAPTSFECAETATSAEDGALLAQILGDSGVQFT